VKANPGLSQLPDGRWRFRLYAAGRKDGPRKQVTLKKGTTHADALRLYRAAVARAAAMSSRPVPRRLTMKAALEDYLGTREARLSKGSARNYEIYVRLHLAPFFGEKPLDLLRAADVEAYQKARTEEHAAPGSVNDETSLLRSMLRKAVAWNWIERDPLPPGSFDPLPDERGRVDYFAPEEWRAFLAAVDDDVRPAFRALLYTGSRLNEVLSLTWGDVDIPGRKVTFTMRKVKGRLKSQRMSAALAEVLEALPRGTPAAHVFTRADGTPWPDYMVKSRFYSAATKAETRETLSVHAIRHTFASWLAIDGVPLRTIAELLGHTSVAMTFRYAHLSPAHLQEAVERIETVEKSGQAPLGRHLEASPEGVSDARRGR
jgi:integrase